MPRRAGHGAAMEYESLRIPCRAPISIGPHPVFSYAPIRRDYNPVGQQLQEIQVDAVHIIEYDAALGRKVPVWVNPKWSNGCTA